jgi:hypothetical protein
MKLQAKGKHLPPPTLQPPLERVSLAVQALPGVISATHWDLFQPTVPDGADFYVGEAELGHIHFSGDMHLATNAPLAKALVKKGLAQKFRYGGPSLAGWTEFAIRTEKDAAHAEWLFRLNHRRLQGEKMAELLADVEAA